jgi:hypothetical protein
MARHALGGLLPGKSTHAGVVDVADQLVEATVEVTHAAPPPPRYNQCA